MLRNIRALVDDNPVLAKDASIAWRATVTPFAVAAAGIGLFLIALFVHANVEPSVADLATWSTLRVSGRTMFSAITGALLAIETLVVPAIAASTIAGERERGTLPLLQVSALSPARIVVGKLLGVLVVAAPIALCAVPLLALAATFGGVSVVHVAGAAVLIVVHGVALASVGVGASSLLKRGRSAAPLAMVFSIGPSLWAALPAAVALAMFGSGENAGNVLPVVLVGALIDVVLAAGALLLARDQLSQQSVPRWPLRRIVLFATFALMPIAAFASNFVEPRDGGDAAILAQIVFLVVGAAVFEVCIADARRVDRRSPLRQSLVVGSLFALGTLASWLVSTEFHHEMPARGIAALAAYGIFATTFTALVASVIKHRVVRPVVAVGLLIAMFLGAPMLHEFHTILGLPAWPLGFTNFATIIDGHASATSGVAFFLASSAVFCFFARVLSRRG